MAVKRLRDDADRALLDRTDHEILKAMEDVLSRDVDAPKALKDVIAQRRKARARLKAARN